MAGILKQQSGKSNIDLRQTTISIVMAEWNEEITEPLCEGARQALLRAGLKKKNIRICKVPGSFELPLAALWEAENKKVSAVICIGCVIQGDTPHFDYVCQGVTQGVMDVTLRSRKPVAFGVLTTLNKKQALERAGGKLGNKGEEAAATVIRMLELRHGS
jgi:6,7-dimethyl-8-ribityllumazine synthase